MFSSDFQAEILRRSAKIQAGMRVVGADAAYECQPLLHFGSGVQRVHLYPGRGRAALFRAPSRGVEGRDRALYPQARADTGIAHRVGTVPTALCGVGVGRRP